MLYKHETIAHITQHGQQFFEDRYIPVPDNDIVHESRWLVDDEGKTYCGYCGEDIPSICIEPPTADKPYGVYREIDRTDFCPNCGAKMWEGDKNQ